MYVACVGECVHVYVCVCIFVCVCVCVACVLHVRMCVCARERTSYSVRFVLWTTLVED